MRIPNWLNSFHIFHSCTILVCSIGYAGFLLHLGRFQHCNLGKFGAHRFKLEVDDIVVFLVCVLQKVFEVYVFPNFVLVWHIVLQKLGKINATRIYFLSFSILGGTELFKLIETRS